MLHNIIRTATSGLRYKCHCQMRQQLLKSVTGCDDTTRGCENSRHSLCSRVQLWSNHVATCLQYSSYHYCRGIRAALSWSIPGTPMCSENCSSLHETSVHIRQIYECWSPNVRTPPNEYTINCSCGTSRRSRDIARELGLSPPQLLKVLLHEQLNTQKLSRNANMFTEARLIQIL